MILAEASSKLGGQFRLAGLQPRRAQITDLIEWYHGQLTKLGVDIRFDTHLDEDDIGAIGADHVVLATGAFPAETGFQKARPHVAQLDGIETGNVWPVEDVLGRAARLGKQVIVLDEGGDWRGVGTAWALAQDGHEVTIVTPDAMVGKGLQRSATDFPARQTLKSLGVRFLVEKTILKWGKAGAKLGCLLTGEVETISAQSLVLATQNIADTALPQALMAANIPYDAIGDGLAPRSAAAAIYEGRKLGLAL